MILALKTEQTEHVCKSLAFILESIHYKVYISEPKMHKHWHCYWLQNAALLSADAKASSHANICTFHVPKSQPYNVSTLYTFFAIKQRIGGLCNRQIFKLRIFWHQDKECVVLKAHFLEARVESSIFVTWQWKN